MCRPNGAGKSNVLGKFESSRYLSAASIFDLEKNGPDYLLIGLGPLVLLVCIREPILEVQQHVSPSF